MGRLRRLTADPAGAQADALVEQARQALSQRRKTEARRALWAALAANPNSCTAWLMLATFASPHASLCYVRHALDLRPNNPVAQAALEWAQQRAKSGSAREACWAAPSAEALPPRAEPAVRTAARMAATRSFASPTHGPLQRFRLQIAATRRWWSGSIRVFAGNRLAGLGAVIVSMYVLAALVHPLLLGSVWPQGIYHPERGYDAAVAPWPAGPSAAHLLGVDAMGRDILSMLMAAAQPTFAVSITAALATAVVGTVLGAVSAYYRGPVDAVLYNVCNALYLLPAPVLMAIIGARYYDKLNAVQFGLVYGVLAGGGSAAIVLRSHALTLMKRPYIDASRVAGAGSWHIITRHLVPHMLPLVLVHMMLAVVGAVVADGFIAFFGLRQVRQNWGAMVYDSINFLMVNSSIPWPAIVAPTAALSVFAAAFYMVARGLEDIANPREQARLRW